MDKRYVTIKDKITVMGIGIGIGIAVTFGLMLVFAFIISAFCTPYTFAVPFATVSLAAGSFVSSFFSARKIGEKGYLIGTLIGVAVFITVTLISLAITSNGFTQNTLFHFLIIVLASAIGGILGVHKNNRKII